jgi:ankyrin repeat protein
MSLPKTIEEAILKNDLAGLEHLIEHCDVDAEVRAKGDMYFVVCASLGWLSTVKYLFSKGVKDPTTINSAVQKSINPNHCDMVEFLIECGAEDCHDECLIRNAGAGNLYIVELLLKQDTNVDAISRALQSAIRGGCTEIVKLLLKHTTDIGYALICSIGCGCLDIVELLLKKGVDVDTIDRALQISARCGCLKTTKMLLRYGARDSKALYIVAKGGRDEIVKLLLDHGATINEHNKYAFWDSALCGHSYGHLEVVKLLDEKFTNSIYVIRNIISRCPHSSVVTYLSEKYAAELDAIKDHPTPPLLVIEYLLEHGAKFHTKV